MNLFKTLIILLFCSLASSGFAQKQQIKKANNFYKRNQYKDAIALYEEALQMKDNLSASTKLAYCYRMTNQMAKAEQWYAKVIENNKAKPITYFYYAESLMSNGKYDLAKNWFLKYNEKVPDDKNAVRMAYACDKVKTLEPYFKNVDIQSFEHNSDVDDSSPLYFRNGIVFTSDRSSGINPLKQKSGWTGRDYQRIYFSSEQSDGHYSSPSNFSKKLNDLNKHCGPVSFTKDQKTVIFTRTGQTLGKNNSYNIQLYSAESDDGKKWKNVSLLSFCNKEFNYMHPAISPDGSKLFFISDKRGGLGGTDIYVSERKGEKWGRPVNLGPVINTSANEAFPFFHSSGKLFFCSKGHLSFGGFDILFSNLKENGSWQKPVNVGKPINSSYDDISISLDESMESGMFTSARDGGDDDIYLFKIMEGINAELESLDFEGLVDEEVQKPNQQSAPIETVQAEPTTRPSSPTTEIIDPSETNIVEERPVTNLDGTIREDQSLETIREEKEKKPSVASVAPPIEEPSIPTDTELVITKEQPAMEPPSVDIVEETIAESTTTSSMQTDELQPDRKVEIMDAPPMEGTKEEIAAVETPVRSMPKPKLEEVDNSVKEVVTKPTKRKKKKKKEKASKKVNLLIPSKKKTTATKEVVTQVSVETSTQTTPPPTDSEPALLSESNTILDQDVTENKPPVLLGDEASMLSEQAEMLPKLAELLQANQPVPAKGYIINDLKYPKGSYLLSPEGTRSLSAVLDLMKLYPSIKIEIGSHTSARGDDIANHNLSRKRAMSIMAFLIYKGIASERITAKGYGETKLLNNCTNGTDCSTSLHAENDRIEVKLMD